jgi:hypothetical protein
MVPARGQRAFKRASRQRVQILHIEGDEFIRPQPVEHPGGVAAGQALAEVKVVLEIRLLDRAVGRRTELLVLAGLVAGAVKIELRARTSAPLKPDGVPGRRRRNALVAFQPLDLFPQLFDLPPQRLVVTLQRRHLLGEPVHLRGQLIVLDLELANVEQRLFQQSQRHVQPPDQFVDLFLRQVAVLELVLRLLNLALHLLDLLGRFLGGFLGDGIAGVVRQQEQHDDQEGAHRLGDDSHHGDFAAAGHVAADASHRMLAA